MKAAFLRDFNGIEGVEIGELPMPQITESEVQVKVEYAGVNPVDWKIANGYLKTRMKWEFPLILGWDAAGVVSHVGKNVKGVLEGDEVYGYCRKAIMRDGSFADYISLEEKNIAKKPKNLSMEQASGVPLAALTAWQSLDHLKVKKGETILVHAGAGGVGGFAIQFAKLRGANVLTTSSASHHPYLQTLNPDVIIDYRQENFVQKVLSLYPEGIDAVFDTVGGETLEESFPVIKKGGRLVSIVAPPIPHKDVETGYVFVSPNSFQLREMAHLFEEGKLLPPCLTVFPFHDVKKALEKSKEGRTQGKNVLKI